MKFMWISKKIEILTKMLIVIREHLLIAKKDDTLIWEKPFNGIIENKRMTDH